MMLQWPCPEHVTFGLQSDECQKRKEERDIKGKSKEIIKKKTKKDIILTRIAVVKLIADTCQTLIGIDQALATSTTVCLRSTNYDVIR